MRLSGNLLGRFRKPAAQRRTWLGRRNDRSVTKSTSAFDDVDEQNRAVILKIGWKTWRFPLPMRNVLEVIRDGRDHSVEELVSSGNRVLGRAMTRAFFATLVKEGILARSADSD